MAAALVVVRHAPRAAQPYLEQVAFNAFHSGLMATCLAGAGVAVVGALTVFRLLPGRAASAIATAEVNEDVEPCGQLAPATV